jgi:hypothetical protein
MRRSILASQSSADPVEPRDNPDTRFVVSVMETRPARFAVFCSSFCCSLLLAIFLDAHLAELLSTARRWRDLIATGIAASRVEQPAHASAKKGRPRGR